MNIKTIITQTRKCGLRKEFSLYLVGGDTVSPNGTLLPFTEIHPPIPYPVKVHRGHRTVDTFKVLERAPMGEWWEGSSKSTEIKKAGDEWWIDTFGMTKTRRMSTGECEGANKGDECLAILVGKIIWNRKLVDYFRNVTLSHMQELPRMEAPYQELHSALHAYVHNGNKVEHLINAQAAVWKLAFTLPPSKRKEHLVHLMRFLAGMGLTRDAAAMNKILGG